MSAYKDMKLRPQRYGYRFVEPVDGACCFGSGEGRSRYIRALLGACALDKYKCCSPTFGNSESKSVSSTVVRAERHEAVSAVAALLLETKLRGSVSIHYPRTVHMANSREPLALALPRQAFPLWE